MNGHREVLLRQEARFVLWILRCGAAAAAGRDDERNLLERGLAQASASATARACWRLSEALCLLGSDRIDWHHPQCDCVSSGEMAVLHALASVAAQLEPTEQPPEQWWGVIVPMESVLFVDRLARTWLIQLHRAGIGYPTPPQLLSVYDESVSTRLQ
jgi:hypothetical protein